MKKSLLLIGLFATMSLSAVSCSADDSDINTTNTTQSDVLTTDNGDRELPKPPQKP